MIQVQTTVPLALPSAQTVEPKRPVTAASSAPAAEAQPSKRDLKEAARQVEAFVQTQGSQLNFTVDDDLGMTIVKVIDPATKEVIRQIPSEEMISIAKALDQLKGLLVNSKA